MSETNPETPAETPATPPPDSERARLEQQLEAARNQVMDANARAAYAQGAAQAVAANAQRPRQSGPDPLDDYSKNDLTMTPEEKRRALASAIDGRARAAEERSNANMEQRLAYERTNMEQRFALDSVVASMPELADPRNAGKFGAAITKAKMEAEAQGIQMSPMQLAQKAKEEYNTLFKSQSAGRPPFVEGANRPDLSPGMQPQQYQGPTPQNALEKTYGIKANSIKPLVDPNDTASMDAFNMEYVQSKNKPLFARGVVSALENVLATNRE